MESKWWRCYFVKQISISLSPYSFSRLLQLKYITCREGRTRKLKINPSLRKFFSGNPLIHEDRVKWNFASNSTRTWSRNGILSNLPEWRYVERSLSILALFYYYGKKKYHSIVEKVEFDSLLLRYVYSSQVIPPSVKPSINLCLQMKQCDRFYVRFRDKISFEFTTPDWVSSHLIYLLFLNRFLKGRNLSLYFNTLPLHQA